MFVFFHCCGNISLCEYHTVLLIDTFFSSFDLCKGSPQVHPQDGWCARRTCCVNSSSVLWIMPLWSFSYLSVFSWGLFGWVYSYTQSGLPDSTWVGNAKPVVQNVSPTSSVWQVTLLLVFTHTFVLTVLWVSVIGVCVLMAFWGCIL